MEDEFGPGEHWHYQNQLTHMLTASSKVNTTRKKMSARCKNCDRAKSVGVEG